tara:strand:- start:13 stop:639 length:627 start_codon:yes stop_codon:yes gene_type:complete
MSHISDITYAHPNYPELLTDKKLKKHWLKWIASIEQAQHPNEKRDMKKQLKILKDAIKEKNFPNAARIPVWGVVKTFRDRNARDNTKQAGKKEEGFNARKFVKAQQPAGQRTHEAQNSKTKTVQAVADIPAEQKEDEMLRKGPGNLERLFDDGEITQDDIDKWNAKEGGRKKSKKRKRRKTKRKTKRKKKSKKSRTRKRKKRRKSKKH